jgi:hypothetical protein
MKTDNTKKLALMTHCTALKRDRLISAFGIRFPARNTSFTSFHEFVPVLKSVLIRAIPLCSLLCALAPGFAAAQTTPVLFSTYNFTGQVLNNPITITALDPLFSDSEALFGGLPITLQPVGGVAATNLIPGDYRVVIRGIGRAWTITVPYTANVVNAAAIPKSGVEGQNTFFWTNALAGVTVNLYQSGIGQTNIALAGITNLSSLQIPSTAVTNPPWLPANGSGAALTGIPLSALAQGAATSGQVPTLYEGQWTPMNLPPGQTNAAVVVPGANTTVTTNTSGGVSSYAVNATAGGGGTVTSVDVSVPGLSSGGAVTTSGTVTLSTTDGSNIETLLGATNAVKAATNALGSAAYAAASAFDLSGAGTTAARNATNVLGAAAYKALSYFDAAGAGTSAAQNATNPLSPTAFSGIASGGWPTTWPLSAIQQGAATSGQVPTLYEGQWTPMNLPPGQTNTAVVVPGANTTVTTNTSGGVSSYAVNASAGGGGGGTVTSVNVSAPGLSSGGAVTASGTVALSTADGSNIETLIGATNAVKAGINALHVADTNVTSRPLYLITTFVSGDANNALMLEYSTDGTNWQMLSQSATNSYKTPAYTGNLRDPNLFYTNGLYYVAYTCGTFGQTNTFAIISSKDLLTWTPVAWPSVASVGSVTETYGPVWFVDPAGGIHVFVSVATSDNGGHYPLNMQIYEMHPTDMTMANWSSPAALGGSWPADIIMVSMICLNGTYYCWYDKLNSSTFAEDTEIASSSSLLTGFTQWKTGDWAGWGIGPSGTGYEGGNPVQNADGSWSMYLDKFTLLGLYVSKSYDNWNTWTAPSLVNEPFTTSNPNVHMFNNSSRDFDVALAIAMSATNTPAGGTGGGGGTVTSVNVSAPGLISGGAVTTSGTVALSTADGSNIETLIGATNAAVAMARTSTNTIAYGDQYRTNAVATTTGATVISNALAVLSLTPGGLSIANPTGGATSNTFAGPAYFNAGITVASSGAGGSNYFGWPSFFYSGIVVKSNTLASCPAVPGTPGDVFLGDTNGVPIIIQSTNGVPGGVSSSWTGTNVLGVGSSGGGTVTSVGLSIPGFSISGSPVTGSGTLTATPAGPVLTNYESMAISLTNANNVWVGQAFTNIDANGVLTTVDANGLGRTNPTSGNWFRQPSTMLILGTGNNTLVDTFSQAGTGVVMQAAGSLSTNILSLSTNASSPLQLNGSPIALLTDATNAALKVSNNSTNLLGSAAYAPTWAFDASGTALSLVQSSTNGSGNIPVGVLTPGGTLPALNAGSLTNLNTTSFTNAPIIQNTVWLSIDQTVGSGLTNVYVDLSKGSYFSIIATTNLFFASPLNMPPTNTVISGTIRIIQDSIGTRSVSFTNGNTAGTWKTFSGQTLTVTTNALARSNIPFETGMFGTNLVYGYGLNIQ